MTKNMVKAIEMELRSRLEKNNFKAIVITMKCNGDRVRISPCYYGANPSWENMEYFLVDAGKVNLCGGNTIEKVAETISRYEQYLEEDKNSLKELKEYIIKRGKDADWDYVSDWYKDLFGHRPHKTAEYMIAWAKGEY